MTLRRPLRAGLDRHAPAIRAILCLVLMVAMLARGLIAPGFMPVMDARKGALAVEMCSGMGAMQMLPPPASEDQHHKPAGSERCPFAALSAPALPAPVAMLVQPVIVAIAETPQLAVGHASALEPAWRPNAPPTGPPPFA